MESWKGQGLAIRDYFSGDKEAKIIIHSSDGDTEDVEVSIFFREFPYIPLIEKAALDLCYGDVIDVGAGAGCHTIELQNRGLNVSAIDVQPDVVDIMKDRGVRDARLGDFRELKDERFDTVLMLMNGIGIVGDLEGLKVFLNRAGDFIRPGGQIVFDSIDLRCETPEKSEDGHSLSNSDSGNNVDSGRYFGEIEYRIEYKGVIYPSFQWLFVDAQTLEDYASSSGWKFEHVMKFENGRYLGRLYR
jgi:SAM-dependent methyltransferase